MASPTNFPSTTAFELLNEYPSADTDSLNAGSFVYRRLEMYADAGKDGNRELVTLESLGREIRGEIN